jgi:hypothetical protein
MFIKGLGCHSVVDSLPSMHKALDSIPSTEKKNVFKVSSSLSFPFNVQLHERIHF